MAAKSMTPTPSNSIKTQPQIDLIQAPKHHLQPKHLHALRPPARVENLVTHPKVAPDSGPPK
ncbi:hypothetical protein L484_010860 [Morus notabilis]|uniref:Uncharacterized protein n=1 Tax=Morus notabilis TaxID=981085 RepID=W9SCC0_9ROSA|nr:hypothetical protein L484_010860 [Morus notabilis]